MHPVPLGLACELRPIIQKERAAGAGKELAQQLCVAKDLSGSMHLVTILQKENAGGTETGRYVEQVQASRLQKFGVQNRIQPRQGSAHLEILLSLQESLHVLGVELTGTKLGVGEDLFVQRDRCMDPLHDEHVERPLHLVHGFFAVGSVAD